jgi:hypothetical protein
VNGDSWIVIPNWDKFQHYKDRDPPWIKLYTELNRRDDWRTLTYAERGLLCSLWTEYCVAGGVLRVSDLGARCGQRVDSRALDSLNHAGFIQLAASKPLALARPRETEKRQRRKTPSRSRAKPATPTPHDEPRINAGAYRKHSTNPEPAREYVPLEQIEAYALKLKHRHESG